MTTPATMNRLKINVVCFKYGVSLDDPCCYPLGFMYVSAMARKLGHVVTVFNLNLYDFTDEEITTGCDVVLMGGCDEFRANIIRVADVCRGKGIRTVLGGGLATFCTEEMCKYVDSIVVGEGEGALETALAIDGTHHGLVVDIESVTPDYEGFGIAEYHARHKRRYMGVLASRGCPFRCVFCSHSVKYRERSLDAVFAEVDGYRQKYGIDYLVVNDNTLNVRKDRFLDFCRRIQGRELEWSAAIRTDVFDEEMVRAGKEAGLSYLVVGVESFDQVRLDKMNKRTTVEKTRRTLDLLHKYRIGYHGNILLGFDQTEDDIIREVESLPMEYNIFPVLMQPFCGVRATPSITGDRRHVLSSAFREFATDSGMKVYPEACAG
jgi:radical SAM superfamily enzyme YgiQ (UPF0313 family)